MMAMCAPRISVPMMAMCAPRISVPMMAMCAPRISALRSYDPVAYQENPECLNLGGASLDAPLEYLSGGYVEEESAPANKDPLLQLVSLQKASGCWLLDAALAAVLEKASEEVDKAKPASVNNELWASILALIWLHGFKMDAQEEWELLAMKTASWIKAQNAPRVPECVEAGNTLLGCSVKKEDLGL